MYDDDFVRRYFQRHNALNNNKCNHANISLHYSFTIDITLILRL